MSPVERINALTTNARNTWFVLLAALVFVGITLMSVEHIDFYGVDRATTLPLINVEVPTRAFFIAAPILIAAIYGYFHLYLIRLWDVLSDAPTRADGTKLGDAISPWLVTDAALHLRRRFRGDNCTTARPLEGAAMLLNIALAWVFGLGILYWLWWSFLPARYFEQTLPAAAACVICTIVGATSLVMLFVRMRSRPDGPRRFQMITALQAFALIVGLVFAWLETKARTDASSDRIAGLDMTGAAIVERPPGWLPYAEARKDYFATWCQRTRASCVLDELSKDQRTAFDDEWRTRRSAALADLRKPDWTQVTARKPIFKDASLLLTFLSGANLAEAQMEGADLRFAQMEGADLRFAQMEGADLFEAQMEGANLSEAQMEGANLRGARMDGANLRGTQMEGANLFEAQMEGANLRGAQMGGGDLIGAQMEGAVLSEAQMEGANLRGAQMEGADLSYSHLTGSTDNQNFLQSTNLSASLNNGGALRFVDLTAAIFDERTDFRNAFLDGSVQMTDAFRDQMGNPCQWSDKKLSDEEFYGRWRGWLEVNADPWIFIAPEKWRDVEPIPPEPGCVWKTGPIVPEDVAEPPDAGQD